MGLSLAVGIGFSSCIILSDYCAVFSIVQDSFSIPWRLDGSF